MGHQHLCLCFVAASVSYSSASSAEVVCLHCFNINSNHTFFFNLDKYTASVNKWNQFYPADLTNTWTSVGWIKPTSTHHNWTQNCELLTHHYSLVQNYINVTKNTSNWKQSVSSPFSSSSHTENVCLITDDWWPLLLILHFCSTGQISSSYSNTYSKIGWVCVILEAEIL